MSSVHTGVEADEEFLPDQPGYLPWSLPNGSPKDFSPAGSFLGQAANPIEVAAVRAGIRPRLSDVRALWRRRHRNRPSPLLLVVLYDSANPRACVCGPVAPDPPVVFDLERPQVERLATAALAEPSRHAAIRFLQGAIPEGASDLPGLRNAGMFATHELRHGVPTRDDWPSVCAEAKPLMGRRGKALIEGLGFAVEPRSTTASVLRTAGRARAVAVFLDETETADGASPRFAGTSPISHALATAESEGLPFVVLTRKDEVRVYSTGKDVGVGRKGRAETFIGANLTMLPDHLSGYLPLLFGPRALAPDGTFEDILERSRDFAAELGKRLRDRVYGQVIPQLAQSVARRRAATGEPSDRELEFLYEQALVILFRLLFIAYAEDKNLLPYRGNGLYQRHALKTHARELADKLNSGDEHFDEVATDLWDGVRQLFRAVDHGNTDWGVPRYNGGLFSADPEVSKMASAVDELELTNAEFGPGLVGLLVDRDGDEPYGPVDFRSLSVRDFGTVYEGLLESSLAIAPVGLALAADRTYVPAKAGEEPTVEAGEIYLRNRSGKRKATGSYFTKPFAVEYLLDRALGPALDRHIQRLTRLLDAGKESEAATAFFDFRCVDLAMGSGHFLVAAIDHIEARLSSFLAMRPVPGVTAELERLKAAGEDALGDLAPGADIEYGSLLRRQVARRCIYGIDKNELAVELARLGLWIHTFVPGLPLSFLDHNLVHGDSLTGIGSLDEAIDVLDPEAAHGTSSFFRDQVVEWLETAARALRRLARAAEATAREVSEARRAHRDALAAVEPARHLFNLAVAIRLGRAERFEAVSDQAVLEHPGLREADALAEELAALHYPLAFPEVFLREDPGFDCVVGNPPWEEATVEELSFWSLRFPGLRTSTKSGQRREIDRLREERPDLVAEYERELVDAERLRAVLGSGPYPRLGGDPDVYKAFAWRFWQLCRNTGAIGIVLPRSIFATRGSAPWRQEVLPASATTVAFCKNRDEWLFTDVNPGYSVGLVSISGDGVRGQVRVSGTFDSYASFAATSAEPGVCMDVGRLAANDPLLAVPAIESPEEFELFNHLLRHPRFGDDRRPDWRAVPATELHATHDDEWFGTGVDGVFNHLNIGHFRFEPSAGTFAEADFEAVAGALEVKRRSAGKRANSPFSTMSVDWIRDPATLPCRNPRIAIRDVVHASNPRKVWAALVPGRTLLTNKAPYLLFPSGDARAQAYVLGMLNCSVCDWFGHLRVVLNLNFFILNALPIPVFAPDDPKALRLARLSAALAVQGSTQELGEWRDVAAREADVPEEANAEIDGIASLLYALDDVHLPLIWPATRTTTRPDLDAVRRYREQWR